MKRLLFLASVTLALTAAPALADNGQVFDYGAQSRAYPMSERLDQKRCFDGQRIRGANIADGKTLYVQSRHGAVYSLQLAGNCAALNDAQKIKLSSAGSDLICARSSAEMTVQTAAGAKQCAIADVRTLTSREVSALSAAARR